MGCGFLLKGWRRHLLPLVLLGLVQAIHPWNLPENSPERPLFYFPVPQMRAGVWFSNEPHPPVTSPESRRVTAGGGEYEFSQDCRSPDLSVGGPFPRAGLVGWQGRGWPQGWAAELRDAGFTNLVGKCQEPEHG